MCCFDENNPFLTETEAGSTEKFLSKLIFVFMKMMLPDVIGHEIQHYQHHQCLCLDVPDGLIFAGQIFTPHRRPNGGAQTSCFGRGRGNSNFLKGKIATQERSKETFGRLDMS